jgi:hypothetical protein
VIENNVDVNAEPTWSVEIVIGDDEQVAMDYAGPRVVGPGQYMVVRPSPFLGPSAESWPSTLHIDVDAPTADEAQTRAIVLYQSMRQTADLTPDHKPRVLTVGHLTGTINPWDVYSLAAEEMFEQQQYALAVVAAQTHCETFIRYALEFAAEREGTSIAMLAPKLLRSCSLTDRDGPKIFEALLGVDPASAECWQKYKDHVNRRNRVVHAGAEVTRELASASIEDAESMVSFVRQTLYAAKDVPRAAPEQRPTPDPRFQSEAERPSA